MTTIILWILLTVFKRTGPHIEPLATCERCGRLLFAAAYDVAPLDRPNDVMTVGSGCCKVLTGHTPAQLAKGEQKRDQARQAEQEELNWQLTVKRWKVANAQVITFLQRKAQEAQEAYEAKCKQFKDNGDRYPSYNDFFESLLEHIEKRGTLSEKQMAVVDRLMSRNESKPLPVKGDKITVSGSVIRSIAKIDPYKSSYNHDAYLVEIDIDNGGQHVRITAREGTRLYKALRLGVNYDLTVQNAPERLNIMGTVKYAKNGLIILTRAKLV